MPQKKKIQFVREFLWYRTRDLCENSVIGICLFIFIVLCIPDTVGHPLPTSQLYSQLWQTSFVSFHGVMNTVPVIAGTYMHRTCTTHPDPVLFGQSDCNKTANMMI